MLRPLTKVLVIRFSSIGDIVLTSAVVRCLRQQLRGAEIHFLTKSQFEPLLRGNPHITKIWEYDHNFDDLIPQLKSQGFTFVVDLHKNYRSVFAVTQLGVRAASFPKLNFRKWLMVRFRINLLPDVHIVDRYFRACVKLGVRYDGMGLDYFIPPADEVDPATLPVSHRGGYVAVVIGGKHTTKIFPADKVSEVCRELSHPVILLGAKEDHGRGELIAGMTGPGVYNGCGLYNLNQSASLVRQALAVMTNDTGLMHVAAAFRKPIVSVWGNTIPGFGMFPFMTEETQSLSFIAEVNGLSCRPCSKLGFRECPKKHFKCMNNINPAPIVSFLNHHP